MATGAGLLATFGLAGAALVHVRLLSSLSLPRLAHEPVWLMSAMLSVKLPRVKTNLRARRHRRHW